MIEIETFANNQIYYHNDIPVLTRHQIEVITEEILEKNLPSALTKQAPVDVEFLVEDAFEIRLDFCTLQPDGAILGETIFKDGVREVFDCVSLEAHKIWVRPGTIILDETMYDLMETRANFTLGHELGHWILHQDFYSNTASRACRSHINQRTYFPHFQAKDPLEWTEWQANTFAAALLLPRAALRITLREFLDEYNLTWKKLSDFSDYRNREKYVSLLDRIGKTYGVSRDTARLRMNKLCGIKFPY